MGFRGSVPVSAMPRIKLSADRCEDSQSRGHYCTCTKLGEEIKEGQSPTIPRGEASRGGPHCTVVRPFWALVRIPSCGCGPGDKKM